MVSSECFFSPRFSFFFSNQFRHFVHYKWFITLHFTIFISYYWINNIEFINLFLTSFPIQSYVVELPFTIFCNLLVFKLKEFIVIYFFKIFFETMYLKEHFSGLFFKSSCHKKNLQFHEKIWLIKWILISAQWKVGRFREIIANFNKWLH